MNWNRQKDHKVMLSQRQTQAVTFLNENHFKILNYIERLYVETFELLVAT